MKVPLVLPVTFACLPFALCRSPGLLYAKVVNHEVVYMGAGVSVGLLCMWSGRVCLCAGPN